MPSLATAPMCAWVGSAWRYTERGRDPLDASGSLLHGGRWNPAGSFAALYFGGSEQAALDDLAAAARALGLQADYRTDFALHEVRLEGLQLLDLRTSTAREAAGLRLSDMCADRSVCQRAGRSVWEAGLHGLLAPAATGSGLVLAVLPDRAPEGALTVRRSWPLQP